MKKRILLVEDDLSILKATKYRLEYEGFEVILAVNGEVALVKADESPPVDLILLDVKLPRLDGFEVMKRLKGNPSTQKIPVIMLTASAEHWRRLVDECIELGIEGWLRKPFRSKDLMDAVRKAFGQEGTAHAA